jgi:hypothetical protein
MGVPDLEKSRSVAGYKPGTDSSETYIHVTGGSAELSLQSTERKLPRLDSANARISAFSAQSGTYRWTLEAEVPLAFTLANAQSCRVRVGGQDIAPVQQLAGLSHYMVSAHAARPLEAICQ